MGDWESDSEGTGCVDRTEYYHSIVDLAVAWCPDCEDPNAVLSFLKDMYPRVFTDDPEAAKAALREALKKQTGGADDLSFLDFLWEGHGPVERSDTGSDPGPAIMQLIAAMVCYEDLVLIGLFKDCPSTAAPAQLTAPAALQTQTIHKAVATIGDTSFQLTQVLSVDNVHQEVKHRQVPTKRTNEEADDLAALASKHEANSIASENVSCITDAQLRTCDTASGIAVIGTCLATKATATKGHADANPIHTGSKELGTSLAPVQIQRQGLSDNSNPPNVMDHDNPSDSGAGTSNGNFKHSQEALLLLDIENELKTSDGKKHVSGNDGPANLRDVANADAAVDVEQPNHTRQWTEGQSDGLGTGMFTARSKKTRSEGKWHKLHKGSRGIGFASGGSGRTQPCHDLEWSTTGSNGGNGNVMLTPLRASPSLRRKLYEKR